MAINWKSKTILVKNEATYGTDPAPTGLLNAMLLTDVQLQPMEGEDVSRNLELPYLGAQEEVPSGLRVVLTGSFELVGSGTAGRPWIKREIVKGWDAGKGVLGIRIHKLLGTDGKPSSAGANPFDGIKHSKSGKLLSTIAPLCSPTGADSKAAYKSINDNIEDWIEQAIAIRKEN